MKRIRAIRFIRFSDADDANSSFNRGYRVIEARNLTSALNAEGRGFLQRQTPRRTEPHTLVLHSGALCSHTHTYLIHIGYACQLSEICKF